MNNRRRAATGKKVVYTMEGRLLTLFRVNLDCCNTFAVKCHKMKRITHCFFCFLMIQTLHSQAIFQKITEGPVVNTPSDSRSVNWADVNGDGQEDLFISNGLNPGQNNLLYINNGDGTFYSVSNAPIVLDNSPSDGGTFADADNDGDLDAFVVTWYGKRNYYYENDGTGTFTNPPGAITGNTGTYSETAVWGDYDQDGLLDIYITNSEGDKRNMLYRNKGQGSFERITGIPPVAENDFSRCANWVDYDNDGDADLFVANENNQPNDLYRNNGAGQFIKVTGDPLVTSGKSSMSASWGDVDNDGDFDVFIANAGYFQEQNNQLFLNNGDGSFTESTPAAINADGGCSYGSAFADVDNDSDLDLVVANGFCTGSIRNFLYLNNGGGDFTPAPEGAMDPGTPCSFGLAFGDYDNDGFQDLAVATCKNNDQAAQPNNLLFKNVLSPAHGGGNANHWLKIQLEGVTSNKSAIGARIRVKSKKNNVFSVWQMTEISAQTGYCGQNSLIAHFGLGKGLKADSVVVDWPGGGRQVLTDVPADQQIVVLETSATGVENPLVNENRIRVSPNPASENATLSARWKVNINRLEIHLIDSLGRTILTENLRDLPAGEWAHQLDLKNHSLAPGSYFVRLAVDHSDAVILLVVNR